MQMTDTKVLERDSVIYDLFYKKGVVFMLKTRELVGIIENALLGINGCVGKPDENGNVDVISADVEVNGHCITLDYSENGQIDRFRINVEML